MLLWHSLAPLLPPVPCKQDLGSVRTDGSLQAAGGMVAREGPRASLGAQGRRRLAAPAGGHGSRSVGGFLGSGHCSQELRLAALGQRRAIPGTTAISVRPAPGLTLLRLPLPGLPAAPPAFVPLPPLPSSPGSLAGGDRLVETSRHEVVAGERLAAAGGSRGHSPGTGHGVRAGR